MQSACRSCAKTFTRDGRGQAFFCPACAYVHSAEAWRATHAVARAVARGDLSRARECSCADCGKPARVHDHRDYTKPLEVDPVCIACNYRRGPAYDSLYRPLPANPIPS